MVTYVLCRSDQISFCSLRSVVGGQQTDVHVQAQWKFDLRCDYQVKSNIVPREAKYKVCFKKTHGVESKHKISVQCKLIQGTLLLEL